MKVNSRFFNPCSMVAFECPDYWSASNQLRRMYDMQLRACCQFKYAHDELGYNVYFVTLTYNNDNVFSYHHKQFNLLGFDQKQVNLFFKRMRDYLFRNYGVTNTVYLCAEELGHTTNRPHLHLCFAIDSKLSDEDVYNMLTELWTFGFIYPNNKDGGLDNHGFNHRPILVKDDDILKSVKYCTKYMLKDVANPNNIYDDAIRYFTSMKNSEELLKVKAMRPKIKTSLGFGSAIEHYLFQQSDSIIDVYNKVLNGLVLDWYDADNLIGLPVYTKNRLFFKNVLRDIEEIDITNKYEYVQVDKDDSVCDVVSIPTEHQKKKKVYRYSRYRSEFYYSYRDSMHDDIINNSATAFRDNALSCVLDNDFAKYCEVLGIYFNNDIFNGVNYNHLACYALFYRNRLSPCHLYDFLKELESEKQLKTKNPYVKFSYTNNCVDTYIKSVADCFGNISFQKVDCKVIKDCDYLPTWRVVDRLDFNPFIRDNDFVYLPNGEENIDFMFHYSKEFAKQETRIFDYVSQLFLHDFPINDYVLFNSFPCFSGFDYLLNVLNEFRIYSRLKKNNVIQDILNDSQRLINKSIEEFAEYENYF